ncbi:Fc receptor-like protein 1 isoform X6 [Prionailurus viverrinus]|uniref:Fc receptor-like protein 1 isoform X6 n=1 Tax=Prionailurus viverrinus TaxID=61388 RepID=UPI001FF1A867|nr:Fc receptor-like protein 1 isoform X6 [Prionailurus viverrinus]
MLLGLMLLMCAPPCELTALLLTATPSRPVEGGSVTLTCNVLVPSRRLDGPRQFCFFRDSRVLWPGWSSSPELQLPKVWREDSGSYWCEEKTMAARVTRSPRVQIRVQRALGLNLETKTQRSLAAKFEIPAVRDSDTDKYYCAADNGYGPSLSELVSVTVRVPVSRPVLTIRGSGAPAEVGDVVELRCEAQRGSPPILYRFYRENVPLGRSSAHAGGGASFNLSLTAEHSGNYSCEANNGLGARRSEAVPLNVTVPTEDRKELLASGILKGMLGVLGPVILALFCCGLRKRLGALRALCHQHPATSTHPPRCRDSRYTKTVRVPSDLARGARVSWGRGDGVPSAGPTCVCCAPATASMNSECCTRGRGLLFGVPHAAGTATSSTAPEDARRGPGESESPSYFPSCSSVFLLPTAPQTLKLMAT